MEEDPKLNSILLWGGNLGFSDPNRYALNLALGLKQKGISLRFYSPGGVMEREFQRLEIPLYVENFLGHTILDIFKFRKLVKEVREFAPQIIHLQDFRQLSPALKLAKKLGIPLMLTVYGVDEVELIPDHFKWIRGIVAVNEEVRENLVNHHKVPKELIRVHYPSVDIEGVSKVKEYEQNQIPVIGTIDNSEKGLSALVLAAEELLKKCSAEFLVVGKSKHRATIEKLAESKSVLGDFTFIETLTHSFSVIPLMDVYVSTQSVGKFGQDLLDAMAWGKGTVAVGRGMSFSLVKDGETGLLVPPEDPQALAEAIFKLIENPELRASLGKSAKEMVTKNFTLQSKTDEMCLFYAKVLRGQ